MKKNNRYFNIVIVMKKELSACIYEASLYNSILVLHTTYNI